MLELTNIHTSYGDSLVLKGVSLRVEPGTVVALLGRNGMGKSTTVHSIIGFAPPHTGEIHFRGQQLRGLQPNQVAQAGLALVPQGRRVFPSLSVRENLTIGARNRNTGRNWTLQKMYELFPILERRANVKGTLLSGGEQQMLCVARALMTDPDMILMDEPSEGLAPLLVRELGRIISHLKTLGLAVLLVEQNMHLALSVADYAYILSKGLIVWEGTPAELHANEDVKSRHLGVTA
ncbi:MAG: ABC transporter ATP-binding protein [Chloroflexaceae bacterium]|jgi:branched-chain amino acid transport system ATP-binding protein|nr:ABC transporter ATP-binding protein [Chloroflexaceae bacterium]